MSDREKRKLDHIHFALETGQAGAHGFDDITFVHNSVPDVNMNQIKLHSKIGELSLSSPILINAMTGGGGKQTHNINQALARVARHCNIPIAVGSQMAAIKDSSQKYTFEVVRKENPSGLIIANIGSEATVEEAKTAADMIEADALQVHLNVIQELVMPEGDRQFSGVLTRIETLVRDIDIPIIVKEVGFGFSKEAAKKLFDVGITIIDVGGYGGTNFSKVENKRRREALAFFNEWGLTTTTSIAELYSTFPALEIIASGGMKSGSDVAKSIALGANVAGFAGHFLEILMDGGEAALIDEIEQIQKDLTIIMTALGADDVKKLQNKPIVIKGNTHHWLTQRGIDTKKYSVR